MKIDRLLAIVLLLLNRRKITAQELSERFEVSVRTIYRDIETIDAAGIPVVSHQGVGGGFAIMDSYRLEKQLLSPEEIMAMVSVLRGVGDALGDEQVRHSVRKMEGLVSKDAAHRWSDEVCVELSPWAYRGHQDALLETVRKAIAERHRVRFTYRNSAGETIDRVVEPMTLVFKGAAWYLFGYCLVKSDYRLFRLSRIRDLFVTAERFERKPYHYAAYAKRVSALEVTASKVVLKFQPKMRFLVEDSFPEEQIEHQADGTLMVRASLPMGDWTVQWLQSFGDQVMVLEPSMLRDALVERLAATLRLYHKT